MQYEYKTQGTCAGKIIFEVNGDIVENIRFIGGCSGNTQGVAALVIGMQIDEAIKRLKGIQCRGGTSCPDQLAIALEQYKAEIA